ncbi:MAG: FtsB family cell division protein [Gemmatimonadales bacterium]
MSPGRWAAIAGLAFALYFALQGGEYGTLDLLQLQRQEGEEQATVARLQLLVDSLSRVATAIEHNPRMQERVAREKFGMLKKGEFLYRLVPDEKGVSGE